MKKGRFGLLLGGRRLMITNGEVVSVRRGECRSAGGEVSRAGVDGMEWYKGEKRQERKRQARGEPASQVGRYTIPFKNHTPNWLVCSGVSIPPVPPLGT